MTSPKLATAKAAESAPKRDLKAAAFLPENFCFWKHPKTKKVFARWIPSDDLRSHVFVIPRQPQENNPDLKAALDVSFSMPSDEKPAVYDANYWLEITRFTRTKKYPLSSLKKFGLSEEYWLLDY
jgi:hypothetical protein